MRKMIKAKFESTETAEYAANVVRSFHTTAKCYIHTLNNGDGYYSYNGNIPASISGANFLSNIFYPIFPENSTLSDIAKNRSAMVEVKCDTKNSGQIAARLISLGGQIM